MGYMITDGGEGKPSLFSLIFYTFEFNLILTMKKFGILVVFGVLLMLPFSYAVSSSSSINWLSKGYADLTYCQQGGSCNLTNLYAKNITTQNINGTFSLNGTDIYDIFVPYSGASANVDLGTNDLTTTGIGTFGTAYPVYIGDGSQATIYTTGTISSGDEPSPSFQIYAGVAGIYAGLSDGFIAGTFEDGTGNSVYLADGTYAINVEGHMCIDGNIETPGSVDAFDILADNYYDQNGLFQWGDATSAPNFEILGDLTTQKITANDDVKFYQSSNAYIPTGLKIYGAVPYTTRYFAIGIGGGGDPTIQFNANKRIRFSGADGSYMFTMTYDSPTSGDVDFSSNRYYKSAFRFGTVGAIQTPFIVRGSGNQQYAHTGFGTSFPMDVLSVSDVIMGDEKGNLRANGDIIGSDVYIADIDDRGTEIITNGAFTGNANGWTVGANWAYASNHVSKTSSGDTTLSQVTVTEIGKVYRLSFKASNFDTTSSYSNWLNVSICGYQTPAIRHDYHYNYTFTCINDDDLVFRDSSILESLRVTIDDVSLTNLTGGDLYVSGNAEVEGNISVKVPYLMVSSNQSQIATLADTVYIMNYTHVEDNYQMELENFENITFLQAGDYLVQLSVIIITDTNNKHFDIFPQTTHRNSNVMANVPRSNTKLEIENAGTEQVISVPFILDMDKGDKFRLMYSSDDAGSMTVFTDGHGTGVNAVPQTPSIIMTLNKISEITE